MTARMSALDALRADVEQVIADHPRYEDHVRGGVWCQHAGHYQFFDFDGDYEAHVSERVMAMLTEEWGLVEERAAFPVDESGERMTHAVPKQHSHWQSSSRLTTRWTTHDTAREGDEQHD